MSHPRMQQITEIQERNKQAQEDRAFEADQAVPRIKRRRSRKAPAGYVTVNQFTKMIPVGNKSVYAMLNDGRIQGFKVGRKWIIPREEIQRLAPVYKSENYTQYAEEQIKDQIMEKPKETKPKETKQEDRPTLNFISPLDGEEHAIGFGYLSGVPYAALFKGELLTAMIPREVLEIAIAQGWE